MPAYPALGRRRFLAACCDGILAVVLGLLLSSTLGTWAASRAAQILQVGDADGFWRGPVPLMLGAIGNLTYALPLLPLLVVLPEALLGVGPGKLLTGLHIVALKTARKRSRMIRFLLKCAPCLAWLLALSVRQPWTLSLFVASLVLFTAGWLPLLRRGEALHDRLAQTQVQASRSQHV